MQRDRNQAKWPTYRETPDHQNFVQSSLLLDHVTVKTAKIGIILSERLERAVNDSNP